MYKEISEESVNSKDYLKDCFMQKCSDEYDMYLKDEETALDKYSKLAIRYLPIISIGPFSTLVLLQTNLNLNLVASFIAISLLIFFCCVMLVVRFSMKHQDNKDIKFYIYNSWTKTIFTAIMLNFGLFVFAKNGISQMLIVLFFCTIAMIYVQEKKRSL